MPSWRFFDEAATPLTIQIQIKDPQGKASEWKDLSLQGSKRASFLQSLSGLLINAEQNAQLYSYGQFARLIEEMQNEKIEWPVELASAESEVKLLGPRSRETLAVCRKICAYFSHPNTQLFAPQKEGVRFRILADQQVVFMDRWCL